MITLNVALRAKSGARLIAPIGFSTPDVAPVSLTVSGGESRFMFEVGTGQTVVEVTPTGEQISFQWMFERGGLDYVESMFQPRDSRFTRAASELVGEVRALVCDMASDDEKLRCLVDHVAGLFQYGHGNPFYEGTNEMPQLCTMTRGSCVDINAYLIACCRAAGIEAGYVTGYFIPEEKRSHTTDMHCWVVTRTDAGVQEWDIAHHMKMGVSEIAPGLNPKPGVRVAMSHSMGWTIPQLGLSDIKLLAEPIWFYPDSQWERADLDINLVGYDLLCTP
ncbi:hypothetical protein NBRC116594_29130 [Shimia sp. NS0008-38b]|uniref:transglutaminase-like domain-containing protein n=1 Tax=Shimia sp. NS0008-38b TaxID=3127653 RepID=UPI003103AF54